MRPVSGAAPCSARVFVNLTKSAPENRSRFRVADCVQVGCITTAYLFRIGQVDPPVVELTVKSVLQSGGILGPDHGVDIELERHRSVAQFGSIRCAHGSRSRVGVNALGLAPAASISSRMRLCL